MWTASVHFCNSGDTEKENACEANPFPGNLKISKISESEAKSGLCISTENFMEIQELHSRWFAME